MRPTQTALRPITRVLTGSGVRLARNINDPRPNTQTRNANTIKDHVYFSRAMAEGPGRNGFVKSFGDSPLDLKMSTPRTVGGKGNGQNPEQLFAMGYASCFLGALQLAAARANKKELAEKAQVTANVFIGHPMLGPDGFGLRAEINVVGCEDDNVIADAHEFCPYSRMLRDGAEVIVNKA